jgi:hypothetical protein
MILSMKTILWPGLLFVVAVGTSLRGAETQTPAPSNEGHSDGAKAKIIEVDPTTRTLTLQAKGANHLFFLNPHVIDTRSHQQITLDQLARGEFISFVSRPRSNGELEIVSLMILHNESGGASGGGTHGGPVEVSPFN